MTELTLDGMLEIIRKNPYYRDDTFLRAVDRGLYTPDIAGKAQYYADLMNIETKQPDIVIIEKTPASQYNALPLRQKQMILADIELAHYQNRELPSRSKAILTAEAQQRSLPVNRVQERPMAQPSDQSDFWKAWGAVTIGTIFGTLTYFTAVAISSSPADTQCYNQTRHECAVIGLTGISGLIGAALYFLAPKKNERE